MSLVKWIVTVLVAIALALGIWKIGNNNNGSSSSKADSSKTTTNATAATPAKSGGGSVSKYCADAKTLFADAKDFLKNVGGDYEHELASETYAQAATLAQMANDAPAEIAGPTSDVATAYKAVKIELQAIHFNPADPSNGTELPGIMKQFQLSLSNVTAQNKQMYDYIQRVCGLTIADATPGA
jgi:hypothetical protein